MKLLIALFLLTFTLGFACEVQLPHSLVVLGEGPDHSAIKTRNCVDSLKREIQEILSEVEGRISAHQINEMLATKGYNITAMEPSTLVVRQLRSLIRDQLRLPPGVQVKTTRSADGASLIAIAPGDQIEVQCAQCLFGSQQPINVFVKGFDGSNKSHLASADFRKMVRAFRFTASTNSFTAIDASMLREEYVESIPHTELITDLEQLKFYRSNKPLRAGELLKLSDLNAVSLVKAGLKTEVVLENQMVRIKTHGISRNNGSIGELVEVFHPQKNKKYQGKVIDLNKVLVEL